MTTVRHGNAPISPAMSGYRVALAALGAALLLGACGSGTPPQSGAQATLHALGTGEFSPLASLWVPTPLKVLWSGVDYANPAQVRAAIQLGKALFWDQQVGEYKDASRPLSGVTDLNGEQEYAAVTGVACASCHYAAGADSRTDAGVMRGGSVGVIASVIMAQQQDGDEICQPTDASGTRQRTGANAPTSVGAIYNRLQFWNGRANATFNGHNPFGNMAGQTSDFPNGEFQDFSSLASQADGPANNPVEMTCGGQNWTVLGTKLLSRRPLGTQLVAASDSVFAGMVTAGRLNVQSYRDMIDAAFPGVYPTDSSKISFFGVIWGQAVQAYERTLQPTQTPFDRYLGGATGAMSALALKGFDVFKGKGSCGSCHTGTVLTDASVDLAQKLGVLREGGGTQGFHNLGVTPEASDPGRQDFSGLDQDRGAFKTPALRNVALTAPYMHDGSLRTLDEVIDFYATGGKTAQGRPMPGAGNPHRDPKLKAISLSSDDRRALKEFLVAGLTDPRTARDAGPFDHPSLTFNDGSTPLCATNAAGVADGCP